VCGFAVCGDKPNNPYVSKVDCLYSCSFGHINCPDGIGAPFSKADIEFVGWIRNSCLGQEVWFMPNKLNVSFAVCGDKPKSTSIKPLWMSNGAIHIRVGSHGKSNLGKVWLTPNKLVIGFAVCIDKPKRTSIKPLWMSNGAIHIRVGSHGKSNLGKVWLTPNKLVIGFAVCIDKPKRTSIKPLWMSNWACWESR
jgi:hypothetical protein